jgi:hypothetical protein
MTIPLHSRYHAVSNDTTITHASFPLPIPAQTVLVCGDQGPSIVQLTNYAAADAQQRLSVPIGNINDTELLSALTAFALTFAVTVLITVSIYA